MTMGRVVRFDEDRGYGFIAPDDGGEDVFVHVNEFAGTGRPVSTGTRVQFNVIEGERGLKAYAVRVLEEGPGIRPETVAATRVRTDAAGKGADGGAVNGSATASGRNTASDRGSGVPDDELCEIFSEAEFIQRVTELLLESAPQLTGGQIVELRQSLLQFARKNSWVDD
jgi:cold shock protein